MKTMIPYVTESGLRRLLPIAAVAMLLAACGEDPAPGEPAEPAVTVEEQEPAAPPAVAVAPPDPPAVETPGYRVECDADGRQCKVDADTFIGWRLYNVHCLACHGPDAKGSSMAPDLMARLNAHVDYDRFVTVMNDGYTGRMGAMPSFRHNTAVMDRLPGIYQYLQARADGALGEGRPERLP